MLFVPGKLFEVIGPSLGFALDTLPIGEVDAGIGGPVIGLCRKVKPELFGSGTAPGHDLEWDGSPIVKPFIV